MECDDYKRAMDMTWDEIYKRADNCAYGSDELNAKDNARWQVRNLILESLGIDIEEAECPEDEVDYYTELCNIRFNEQGYIRRFKVAPLKGQA